MAKKTAEQKQIDALTKDIEKARKDASRLLEKVHKIQTVANEIDELVCDYDGHPKPFEGMPAAVRKKIASKVRKVHDMLSAITKL